MLAIYTEIAMHTVHCVTRAPSPRIHPFVTYLPYPPYIISILMLIIERTTQTFIDAHKPNARFHTYHPANRKNIHDSPVGRNGRIRGY